MRSKVSRAPALLMSCSLLSLFTIMFATTLQEDSSEVSNNINYNYYYYFIRSYG